MTINTQRAAAGMEDYPAATPEQIELSRTTTDLGDFIDKLNELLPHFRATVSVEYRYGLPPLETRELRWGRSNGDYQIIAELDVVTTGNIPGRPEFGGLSHRLRGVVIHEATPYGVGAVVAELAINRGLKSSAADVEGIPF